MEATDRINWHPRFNRIPLKGDQLYLIGETESFLLQGECHQLLFRQMDGQKCISELVRLGSSLLQQAAMVTTIDQLSTGNFITSVDEILKTPESYYYPDISKSLEIIPNSGKHELWNLSRVDRPEGLAEKIECYGIQRRLTIVIVDDYLDPRLADINRFHLDHGRDWIIIKPTGERPSLSPLFSPGGPGPCWRCLHDAILQNQPVRRWIGLSKNTSFVPVPIRYDPTVFHDITKTLVNALQEYKAGSANNRLREVDPNDLSLSDRFVRRRPQCSHCGDPSLFALRNNRPLVLQNCLKISSSDGGARAKLPERTVKDLKDYVDSVTGVVFGLSNIQKRQNGIATFRTAFCKTPNGNGQPDTGDFIQISLGKGISIDQSKASAICESIERYTAQYQGDEPVIIACPDDLEFRAIGPQALAQYSAHQYQEFAREPQTDRRKKYRVKQLPAGTPLPWTMGWSLTHNESCYIPFTYCFANTPFTEEHYCRFNSNGCAAGNTLEEAILQGFLELVERDATAIWWYNRIPRPAVSPGQLGKEVLEPLQQTLDEDWDYWLLDLTQDFLIPVIAAVGKHKQTETFRFGFGCHLDISLACQRALTELCQIIAIDHSKSSAFDFNQIPSAAFLYPDQDSQPKAISDFIAIKHDDIKEDIELCNEIVQRLGLEIIVVETTRPDIPLYTVKVLVPGLSHIWPQLGNERLVNVPCKMQWRKTTLTEDQLNPLPLLV